MEYVISTSPFHGHRGFTETSFTFTSARMDKAISIHATNPNKMTFQVFPLIVSFLL
jgi:hypothetical protein